MSITRALHETAMEYADRASLARLKGDGERVEQEFFQKAFELEREAALQMPLDVVDHVPRSILLRSTAALAYKAGLYAEAEKFVRLCLSDNPPDFIVKELNDIQEALSESRNASRKSAPLYIEGVLTDINSRENEIIMEDSDNHKISVMVMPRQVLFDIVQKYWSKKVSIQAHQTPHGVMVLEKISAAA